MEGSGAYYFGTGPEKRSKVTFPDAIVDWINNILVS